MIYAITNIQALRFIASLATVIFHCSLFLPGLSPYKFGMSYLEGSVDIFFVISGFIIHYTNYFSSGDRIRFLKKRLKRVYIPYWIVLLVCMPILIRLPYWNEAIHNHAYYDRAYIESFIANVFLLRPTNGILLLLQSWTLCFEVFFYIIFCVTLSARPSHRFFIVAVVFTLFLLGMTNIPQLANSTNFFIFPLRFLNNTVVYEFLFGMLFAYLYLKNFFGKPDLFLCLGILLILIGCALSTIYTMDWRILRFGILASGVVLSVTALDKCGLSPLKSLSIIGGDISYELYLIHTPMIYAVTAIGNGLFHIMFGFYESLFYLFTIIIFSIAASGILHYRKKISAIIFRIISEKLLPFVLSL